MIKDAEVMRAADEARAAAVRHPGCPLSNARAASRCSMSDNKHVVAPVVCQVEARHELEQYVYAALEEVEATGDRKVCGCSVFRCVRACSPSVR